MRLIDYQRQFQATLLAPTFASHDDRLTRGLRVHHNHFWTRMRDYALYRFPLLQRYLGDADFTELVRAFIVAHPPPSYGVTAIVGPLIPFVATTPPWSGWPVVAALAEFDFARSGLALCAEEATLTHDQLRGLPRDELNELPIRLKKRATIASTRLDMRPGRLRALPRDAAVDREPEHWLLHIGADGLSGRPLAAHMVDVMRRLQLGITFGELGPKLAAVGLSARAFHSFVERCLHDELLVVAEMP